MADRYLGQSLPALTDATRPADLELRATAERAAAGYHAAMRIHHLDEALSSMMELVRAANGYAESQAPWSLNKAGEDARLGQVLAVMGEACRIIGHLLAPVAPTVARELHHQLGVPPPYDERGAGGPGLEALLAWGAGPAGWTTGSAVPLFPRIEVEVAS
jgi:methionyl-tRNA synthetase